MKRNFILVFLLSALFSSSFIACSDDDDNSSPSTDKYIPTKIIYDDVEKLDYEYNDKNQIIKVINEEGNSKAISIINYNEDGTPKKVVEQYIEYGEENREETVTIEYTYEAGKVLVKTTDATDIRNSVILIDEKGRRKDYIDSYYNGMENIYTSYQLAYDANDNLISSLTNNVDADGNPLNNGWRAEVEYKYDDKNNTAANVNGPHWFKSEYLGEALCGKNNITQERYTHSYNGEEPITNKVDYTYTYNDAGYPILRKELSSNAPEEELTMKVVYNK